jgi:hypothetical protein
VLSGDSAEFQFAAPLLAVPHPTGYPLYTVLGYLASLVPGDAARRVTQVSVLCGAACGAAFCCLAYRLLGSLGAALVAALALGLSPGLWNAATLAEVYALNALLIVALALALAYQRAILAAFVSGLGISHHLSFVLSAAPLLLLVLVAVPRLRSPRGLALLVGAGLLGLSPWLYPLVQYARHGPFSGADHGLPVFYFWGAPRSWGEALAHLGGGALRAGATHTPSPTSLLATARMVGERLAFEFGVGGLILAALGMPALWRRSRAASLAALWVCVGTYTYLALLGPSVQDAPVFTLPLLLPVALWVGAGALWSAQVLSRLAQRGVWGQQCGLVPWLRVAVLGGCLALTLSWGASRRPYADKAHLWVFRSFGEQALTHLAPDAAVLVSWEQGTILQYLRLVDQQRPDVWIDIVEPGDESWPERAQRYPNRPVYFLGHPAFFPAVSPPVVWQHDYASLYRYK